MFSVKYQPEKVSRHIGMAHTIFLPYRCNVCLLLGTAGEIRGSAEFRLSDKVKFCRGCQFTRYCSEEHQAMDLNAHRQLCSAFQEIKRKLNIKHPYLVRGQPTTEEKLERAAFQVKYMLRQIMKRPLNYSEEEQTSFPPHCAICYTFENVTPCADCAGVGYCSEEHAKEGFENHRLRCGLLQTYYCRFKLCYPLPPENIVKNLNKAGKDMAELDLIGAFQVMTNLKLPICPTQTLSDYQLFACAGDFNTIATICFTLPEFKMTSLKVQTEFVLFIIGASIEADLWFQEIHTKFFFLQQPNITTLELYFIGPKVEPRDPKKLRFTFNLPIVAVVKCSWGAPGDGQYHIQTDEGPERSFRFQTDNGQFRKEKRLQDGTVVGTEAWIDAAGFLRQKDYIADKNGYRILKSKTIFVGHGRYIEDAIKSTKSAPAQSGVLVDGSTGILPHSNSVAIQNDLGKNDGYVYSTTTTPSPVPSTTARPTALTLPAEAGATDGKLNYLSPEEAARIAPTPYLGFDHYPDELPRLHAHNYERQRQPVVQIRPNSEPLDDPHSNITDGDYYQQLSSTIAPPPQTPALSMQLPYDTRGSSRRRVRPIAILATTPAPITADDATGRSAGGYRYSTPVPFLPSPPVSSTPSGNGFYYQRETTAQPSPANVVPLEVNQLEDGLLPPLPRPTHRRVHPTQQPNSIANTEYNGVGVTRNGFRYFLPQHYHEEEQFEGEKRAGSYGYVDPFGIRRVVYYNAAPGRGFVHRNNNRYVGLGATPFDPVAS